MYLFILANALVYILYGSSSPYKNINSNANNNVNIRNVSFFPLFIQCTKFKKYVYFFIDSQGSVKDCEWRNTYFLNSMLRNFEIEHVRGVIL